MRSLSILGREKASYNSKRKSWNRYLLVPPPVFISIWDEATRSIRREFHSTLLHLKKNRGLISVGSPGSQCPLLVSKLVMYRKNVPTAAVPKSGMKKGAMVIQGTGGAFLAYLAEEGIRCRTRGNSGFRRLFDIPCNDLTLWKTQNKRKGMKKRIRETGKQCSYRINGISHFGAPHWSHISKLSELSFHVHQRKLCNQKERRGEGVYHKSLLNIYHVIPKSEQWWENYKKFNWMGPISHSPSPKNHNTCDNCWAGWSFHNSTLN